MCSWVWDVICTWFGAQDQERAELPNSQGILELAMKEPIHKKTLNTYCGLGAFTRRVGFRITGCHWPSTIVSGRCDDGHRTAFLERLNGMSSAT